MIKTEGTTTKKFNTFLSRPLQDCTLSEIPGVGKSSLIKLTEVCMDSPEKLMGMFLVLGRDKHRMKQWLITAASIRAQESDKISNALERKSQSNVTISNDVINSVISKRSNALLC